MKLPDQAIKQFQEAWRASFAEDISPERAQAEGSQLLATFSILTNQNEYEHRKPKSH